MKITNLVMMIFGEMTMMAAMMKIHQLQQDAQKTIELYLHKRYPCVKRFVYQSPAASMTILGVLGILTVKFTASVHPS